MIKLPQVDHESIIRLHEARISKIEGLLHKPLFDRLEFVVRNNGLRRLASSLGGKYFATYQQFKIVPARLPGEEERLTGCLTREVCCGGHDRDIDALECLRKQGKPWHSVYCILPGLAMIEAQNGGWKIVDYFLEDIEEADQAEERRAA